MFFGSLFLFHCLFFACQFQNPYCVPAIDLCCALAARVYFEGIDSVAKADATLLPQLTLW